MLCWPVGDLEEALFGACLPPSSAPAQTHWGGDSKRLLPPPEPLSTPHSTCAPLDGEPGDVLELVWLLGHSKRTAEPKVPGRGGQAVGDRQQSTLWRIWEHLGAPFSHRRLQCFRQLSMNRFQDTWAEQTLMLSGTTFTFLGSWAVFSSSPAPCWSPQPPAHPWLH